VHRKSLVVGAGVAALAAVAVVVGLVAAPVTAEEPHGDTGTTTASAAARLRDATGVRDQVVTGHVVTVPSDAGAVTYAYAGDSITARPDSWLHVLAADPHLDALGGYAHSGYRSDQVLASMPRVPGADVLVIELGTNDINQARDLHTVVSNVDAVAARVGAPHVLLVAAPPSDHTSSLWGADRRTGSVRLNRLFRADARTHGWTFADPFAAYRTSDNAWRRGSSADGIHPTARASRAIATAVAAEIVTADAGRLSPSARRSG
jgi:hypothetical protein